MPNFAYTYGAVKCNDAYEHEGKMYFCNDEYDEDIANIYTISEYIGNSQTLEDFLLTLDSQDIDTLLPILILHIFSILRFANEQIGFVHYDLHARNILLTHSDEYKIHDIYLGSDKWGKIRSKITPYIIDYDFSRVRDVDTGKVYEYENLKQLVSYHSGDMFYDICRLLLNISLLSPKIEEKCNEMWSYYSNVHIADLRKELFRNWLILPQIYGDVESFKPVSGFLEHLRKISF
jgi:hypothetical protein